MKLLLLLFLLPLSSVAQCTWTLNEYRQLVIRPVSYSRLIIVEVSPTVNGPWYQTLVIKNSAGATAKVTLPNTGAPTMFWRMRIQP